MCERALPLLANALVDADERLVVVLDDYHLISSPEVHRSVQLFIDMAPRATRLAIATRDDPPFPLD